MGIKQPVKTKQRKILRTILMGISALLILVCAWFFIYTEDYYHADFDVEAYMALSTEDSRIVRRDGLTIIYPPIESDVGFIFYPGGKVEETAYIPLLERLASKGITCVLVQMPFRLAVFGVNSADTVYEQLPDIEKWYLGGHSLGGAMASSYVGEHEEKLAGLILLGAYPVNESPLPTLTIYGSEDMIVNRSRLEPVYDKIEISGGNHAYFGNYGEQDGDGTATITREEQQKLCVELIMEFTD